MGNRELFALISLSLLLNCGTPDFKFSEVNETGSVKKTSEGYISVTVNSADNVKYSDFLRFSLQKASATSGTKNGCGEKSLQLKVGDSYFSDPKDFEHNGVIELKHTYNLPIEKSIYQGNIAFDLREYASSVQAKRVVPFVYSDSFGVSITFGSFGCEQLFTDKWSKSTKIEDNDFCRLNQPNVYICKEIDMTKNMKYSIELTFSTSRFNPLLTLLYNIPIITLPVMTILRGFIHYTRDTQLKVSQSML